MRFKMGLAAGLGFGYLLGARAGRYRYDQIMKWSKQMWSSPELATFRDSAGRIAGQVQEQAAGAFGGLRDRKITLDDQRVEDRIEPYVAAAHSADGGVLPHNEPL
jgi:hypothetical protein